MKYSDLLVNWLSEMGYTHCFFVAGGNIMHLLESCSHKMAMIPFVHEVAAGIAVEYFNEASEEHRAFALVTAGPGLTNILTAMAGAYLESRELLVIGGQVKVSDLARGEIRQRGIQEIDGVRLAKSISVKSMLIDEVVSRAQFSELVNAGSLGRRGPIFAEIPLDIQAASVDAPELSVAFQPLGGIFRTISEATLDAVIDRIKRAQRPVLLLGGGVNRATTSRLMDQLAKVGIPLMLTWNGIDRIPADHPMYFGRPNTWGQRAANILIQQTDLLVALGTRLGLQQTGFNWQEFIPIGEVIQVECDEAELKKGHPRVDMPICGDANAVLELIASLVRRNDLDEWISFCREVKSLLPLNEPANHTGPGFISPYEFCLKLSDICSAKDVVVPCSSGSANTVMQQTFQVKRGQIVFNDKGLASMGYGLSGAIGASIAAAGRKTILVEGDGGFIQNLQELGTVRANNLNVKMFIFDDSGYASIRMTQKNYFGGRYIGCDKATGLGIPIWSQLFMAYSIPMMEIGPGFEGDAKFLAMFNSTVPAAFLVKIDPEQTYYPKITSRITKTGSMASNPLHLMTPELSEELASRVMRYLEAPSR